jgi:hypothetical protein
LIVHDNSRPSGDEARKLSIAFNYYRAFSSGNLSTLHKNQLFPPLYFFLPSFVSFVIQCFSYKICVSQNILYYIITAFFTYLLTQRITKQHGVALYAVCVVSLSNALFVSYARLFVMEIALCSVTCICIFFLYKSMYFQRRYYSGLFGTALAAGMLIKYTFIIYIIGPMLVYVVQTNQVLKTADRRTRIYTQQNIVYSVLLATGLFYVFANPVLDFHAVADSYQQTLRFESTYSGVLGHVLIFVQYLKYLGVPSIVTELRAVTMIDVFFVVLMIYAIYSFVRICGEKNVLLLLSCYLIPILILSVILRNEDARYILPVIPAQGIIVTIGLMHSRTWIRMVFMTLVAFYFLSNIIFLCMNMDTRHPIEVLLNTINSRSLKVNNKKPISLMLDVKRESLNDVVQYFIAVNKLDIDFVDFKRYIRLGQMIQPFNSSIMQRIKTVDYVLTDYEEKRESSSILNGVIRKKEDFHYTCHYDDSLLKCPKAYWPLIKVYQCSP